MNKENNNKNNDYKNYLKQKNKNKFNNDFNKNNHNDNFKNIFNIVNMFLILILISSFMFLTSCSGNLVGNKDARMFENYHVGTKGLSLDFVRHSPPTQIYEAEDFSIHGILKNEGAFDITNQTRVKFKITYDNYAFSSLEMFADSVYKSINGRSDIWPYGEVTDFTLARARANALKNNFESFTTDFFVTMCYPYKTFFGNQICIDTDIRENNLENKVCTNIQLDYNNGQGAPVAITQITPSMLPFDGGVEPVFTVTVKNVGEGLVFEPKYSSGGGVAYTCSDEANVNVVKIDAKIQGEELVCAPNLINLVNGEGKTNCKFKSPEMLVARSNYYALLEIVLEYNYQEIYPKKVQILKRDSLAFMSIDTEYKRCQKWEIETSDGKCENLCSYCSKNPKAIECTIYPEDTDKTIVGDNFACIYNYESCNMANKFNTGKESYDNKCILRENLCPPFEYCGIPMCTIGNNNFKPKIKVMTGDKNDPYIYSEDVNEIQWVVADSNDNMNVNAGGFFDERNLYPDSKRICGLKVDNQEIPISYYVFIESKDDTCDGKTFKEAKSIYGYNVYPARFKASIEKDADNINKKFVCIRAVDKQGLEVVNKYEIETDNLKTRLDYKW